MAKKTLPSRRPTHAEYARPIGPDPQCSTRRSSICRSFIDDKRIVRFAREPEATIEIEEAQVTLAGAIVEYRFPFLRLEVRARKSDGIKPGDWLCLAQLPYTCGWTSQSRFKSRTKLAKGEIPWPGAQAPLDPIAALRWVDEELSFDPWHTAKSWLDDDGSRQNTTVYCASSFMGAAAGGVAQHDIEAQTYVFGASSDPETCFELLAAELSAQLKITEELQRQVIAQALAGPTDPETRLKWDGAPVIDFAHEILQAHWSASSL